MSRSSRVAFPLTSLLLVVAGTGCEAVYDYTRAQHGGHGPGDPPPPVECHADADCRAFSNYCDGCACDALAAGENDPVCSGHVVQCLVDPCGGKKAICKAGQCVLDTLPPPPAECHTDADCRTLSNYCGGCACDALAVGAKDPICNGMLVQCFADPCLDKTAACTAGRCALAR